MPEGSYRVQSPGFPKIVYCSAVSNLPDILPEDVLPVLMLHVSIIDLAVHVFELLEQDGRVAVITMHKLVHWVEYNVVINSRPRVTSAGKV